MEGKSTVVKVIIRLIRSLLEGIADLDEKIEEAVAAHPDFFIFDSLPGAGAVLAPRLLAAFGSQRERYGSAGEVQAYSGIAAVKGEERKKQVGTLPHRLPQVSTAKLSRMGGLLHRTLGVGTKRLPATTPPRRRTPPSGTSSSVQMDSHCFVLGRTELLVMRANIRPRSPGAAFLWLPLMSLLSGKCEQPCGYAVGRLWRSIEISKKFT